MDNINKNNKLFSLNKIWKMKFSSKIIYQKLILLILKNKINLNNNKYVNLNIIWMRKNSYKKQFMFDIISSILPISYLMINLQMILMKK